MKQSSEAGQLFVTAPWAQSAACSEDKRTCCEQLVHNPLAHTADHPSGSSPCTVTITPTSCPPVWVAPSFWLSGDSVWKASRAAPSSTIMRYRSAGAYTTSRTGRSPTAACQVEGRREEGGAAAGHDI